MPLKFTSFLLLSAALSGCTNALPRRVPWETAPRLITENFTVYTEPRISDEEIIKKIQEAEGIWKEFKMSFYPAAGKKKLKILIYLNQKSYSHYRRVPIDSLADYERRENRMNISIDAPAMVWKHELSHAMLESARPGSPYWLHEGMALFLQAENFSQPVNCRFPQKTSMPESLAASIEELRSKDKLIPGKEFRSGSANSQEFHVSTAGYFIFYLWDKRLLLKMLHEYQQSRRSAKSILTKESNEKMNFIIEDFTEWIKTSRPLMTLSGC